MLLDNDRDGMLELPLTSRDGSKTEKPLPGLHKLDDVQKL